MSPARGNTCDTAFLIRVSLKFLVRGYTGLSLLIPSSYSFSLKNFGCDKKTDMPFLLAYTFMISFLPGKILFFNQGMLNTLTLALPLSSAKEN